MNTSKLPKKLLWNIAFIAIFAVAMMVISSCMLSMITHHDREIAAPDLVGLTVSEAKDVAKKHNVRIEVIDTTYVKSVQRGGVFMQDPSAGSMVKKNRRIRLVVNAMVPRRVPMPNVEDCPVRQAVSDLNSKGFVVGRLYYVAGNDDLVQQQMIGSKRIAPGTMVESGTAIDLRVGLDPNYRYTSVPNVQGERAQQAVKDIQERSLNVKRLSYDSSIRSYSDSTKAVVYRQTPDFGSGQVVKGTDVTLYLSVDPDKISK